MSRAEGRPIGWREALVSRLLDPARLAWLHLPGGPDTPRERAFPRYRKQVRQTLRGDPGVFTVIESRTLAESATSKVMELTLASTVNVQPADLLYVAWRNAPEAVAAAAPARGGGDRTRYWTTPLPYRSSRLARATTPQLLSEVYDFGKGASARLHRTPRIVPRLYTASHAEPGAVRLQVTYRRDWPQRAAAFLQRLRAGEELLAWVFPHPHRLPAVGQGTALVTGSGAAAVFAALRAGRQAVELIWGLGDKRPAPWVMAELESFVEAGALEGLRVTTAPRRVTDEVDAARLTQLLAEGGWLYVSGNREMGAEVERALRASGSGEVLDRAFGELRYIVST